MLNKTKPDWWKSAVFYQVYPKSFQDTNGDGIGDIPGIIQRLDYLETLGIDGIWLSPVYTSPQKDNGYDIADYRAIDPRFGTMEDMENLIVQAEQRGITIIMDLVLNHTSDQHYWFLEARASKDSPRHGFYIWRDGTPDCPPNDMTATFGGLAWTYVPEIGQWYFHQFSPWQPDLNWENLAVRQELCEMIRFWVDKGVGGFRLDVIDNIGKEPDHKITCNGPRLHKYIQELRREAFREDTLVTVGEAWSADAETAKRYANPDSSELGMTNIRLSIEEYDDLEIKNAYQEQLAKGRTPAEAMAGIYARGRDNARTPMQWLSGEYAGFSQAKPWLPLNPNYTQINAEAALADPDSIFFFYQRLIALRKTLPALREGGFTLLNPKDKKVFAYTQDTEAEHLLVVCNFTAEGPPEVLLDTFRGAEILLDNYPDPTGPLRPYETRILYVKV